MKIRELIRFTKKLLKGRRARTMMICILPLAAELFFRFAEAAAYSLLLYFGELDPIALFGGDNPLQLSVTVVSTVLRWIITAPLMYAAAFRLAEICEEAPLKRMTPFSRVLLNKRSLRRSLSAALWTRIAGLLALAPAVFFGITAYSLFGGSLDPRETFLAVNALVLTAASLYLWLSLKLALTAVPYLLVKLPKKTAFRTVLYSIGFMRGRKNVPLRIFAVYLPQLATVAGLPYGLTKMMAAYSLSIDIFIKEDEYLEANKADGGYREPHDAAKLPRRKKRRFKAAADEAQTA